MSFYHGVKANQVATSILPSRQISASIPVFVGCAPIHRLSDQSNAAKNGDVVLCYTAAEAAQSLGYTGDDDFQKWGLSEAAYVMFTLYQCAPAIFINIFDPDEHKAAVTGELVSVAGAKGKLSHQDIISCIVTYSNSECIEGTDYSLNKATGTISISSTGSLKYAESFTADYSYATPETVTTNECIGGADYDTGKVTGIQLVDEIFTRFRVIPGSIIAPGFSDNPSVAAIMATKAGAINGIFRGIAIADLPTTLKNYTKVPEYKNNNNLVQEDLVVCWPRVVFNEKVMRIATLSAGVIANTDADNSDIPYVSPSNKSMQMQSASDGEKVLQLNVEQANYLNSNGVVTVLNFIGGWKLWGNRTACYPDVTDIKDTFISNRRMFGWYGNKLITTWWQKVDDPINRRFVQTIVNSEQVTLNNYAANGYILGGRIEFLSDENSTTDLMDSISKFHIYWGTTSPAEQIIFTQEYDPDYLSTLF